MLTITVIITFMFKAKILVISFGHFEKNERSLTCLFIRTHLADNVVWLIEPQQTTMCCKMTF